MRYLLCLVLSLFVATGCFAQDAVFRDTQGHTIQASQLKGKWLVVTYWAEWCGSCRKEIPELNKFNQIRDKNVLLYGVSYESEDPATLKQIVKKLRIQYPVLTSNPANAWNLEEVSVLPTTFIINPQGKVVKKIVGETSARSLARDIRNLQS